MVTDQELISKARELKEMFTELAETHSGQLWNYCRYLTGSPWDGEDLFQETMLKALGGLFQRWHPTNTKSYLYRMATNIWIDHCRREKRNLGTLDEEEIPAVEFTETLELQQALGCLVELFKPRQIAVFLLFEVFQFKAEEVAGMARTTPGAVYATTRRMKEKLKQLNSPETPTRHFNHENEPVIKAYLKALNEGDVEAVLNLISDQAQNEAPLGFAEFSKEEMRNGSLRYGLPGYRAEPRILWGKPVIIVFADEGLGPLIHDIQYQETENGKIVRHVSYFFRKEFILAAAEELGVPAQLTKPPVDWAR
ncbi:MULTISPECIES: RNA polymerase sigma factor [Bacillus]|uniref:RNA polymerase sigma factor n=1 Tax=Bacillus TaxID=1386 RepID=UPI00215505A2|nr:MULTISPECIES: RNA polymerase sigma factor [Bacillus]MCR6613264.1 RNA polymerase sigma factor [Bacillus infantis]MDT0161305.1 RNA polymerase sigma factor [Bacillus sp. AG4(2022)]